MKDIIKYTVDTDGIKLVDFLKDKTELSGRFIKKASKENRIHVDGNAVNLGQRLYNGDIVTININKREEQNITPEAMDIKVIYEDSDILVVDKESFMLVHPTKNHPSGTLTNGVLYHFKKNNENCIVRLVSRLDRDTSGLVLIAKNSFAHMSLAKAMEENKIVKTYYAIVHGKINPCQGTIDLPIGKSETDPIKRAVNGEGQRSITHYKVIEEYSEASLLELTLETGRTHQIRVHLSYLGNPIYGDCLYGKEENYINRQALHAGKLSFPHPRTGEFIALVAQIPKDMNKLLDILKLDVSDVTKTSDIKHK